LDYRVVGADFPISLTIGKGVSGEITMGSSPLDLQALKAFVTIAVYGPEAVGVEGLHTGGVATNWLSGRVARPRLDRKLNSFHRTAIPP